MKEFFSQFLSDFWHGAFWKVSSIAAKGWFLVIVFPLLPEGALGMYVYIVSLGAIGGRFFAAGLDVELPLFIRARRQQARRCLPVYSISLGLVLLSLLVLHLYPASNSAILVLSLAYTSHFILAGLVRSVNPAAHEILGSLHSLVFAIMASVPLPWEGTELALMAAISLLVSQLFVLEVTMGRSFSKWPQSKARFTEMVAISRRAATKLATNLTFAASMRGIVIWPKVLLGINASDTFGFAVTAGEALFQSGMIIVNRSYARFCGPDCSRSRMFSEALGRGVALSILFSVVGLVTIFLVPNVIDRFDVNWTHVGILFLMYGPLCFLQLIRFAMWALDRKVRGFVGIFLGWNLLQAATVLALDVEYWPAGVVLSAVAALVAAVSYAWGEMKGDVMRASQRAG